MHRLITLLFLTVSICGFAQVTDPEPGYLTADGPYIFNLGNGLARVVSVDMFGNITDTIGVKPRSFNVVSHDGRFSFEVALHGHSRQNWELPATDSTFILSDPHGRMDCLVSILQAGGVIDDKLNWAFGPNRMVLIGDVMDRGDDVTQIFWLLYKLEEEAREAGGSVTMVYGNHEAMVLAGDLRYCREKYKALADSVGLDVPGLYGASSELGGWLAGFNTLQKVGDDLFVHGGTGGIVLELGMDAPEINELFSEGIFLDKKEKAAHSETMKELFKNKGPVWYRVFFENKEKWGGRMDSATLDRILEKFGASRVFVGHTIFRKIRSMYGGRVVHVDVDAKVNHDAGGDRAVLLAGRKAFVVRDSGAKRRM